MAQRISPGVFTTILDLSEYVRSVSSTIGFLPIICEKGRDNKLILTNARDFYKEFGEPNFLYHSSTVSQGPLVASQFLKESDNLYVIRCMPDGAKYSTLFVAANNDEITTTLTSDGMIEKVELDANLNVASVDFTGINMSYLNNIESLVESYVTGPDNPIIAFRGTGRGKFYNDFQVNIYEHPNYSNLSTQKILKRRKSDGQLWPVAYSVDASIITLVDAEGDSYNDYSNLYQFAYTNVDQIYAMDIYQKQKYVTTEDTANSEYNIVATFEVSLNPSKVDVENESMYIEDIVNTYFDDIQVITDKTYLTRLNEILADEIIISDGVVDDNTGFLPTDSSWVGDASTFNSLLVFANEHTFWDDSGTSYDVEGIITEFNVTNIFSSYFDTSTIPNFVISKVFGVPLVGGSDGDLGDASSAATVLAQAYSGSLDAFDSTEGGVKKVTEVLDTENYYFNIILDAGYPSAVKYSINDLARTRRDSLAIIDNGDNKSAEAALTARTETGGGTSSFNNRYLAIYEPYTKIYDSYSGKYIWVSPVYHMANIIPYSDNVSELWFAPAGFNRGAVENIADMRFSPSLGEREVFAQNQINPIVKFNSGYVVWGQLTSQRKASSLQDVNVVRLVLYIKKALEDFTKYYIFEQNDSETWGKVATEIRSFLQGIQNRRGLRSFDVSAGATDYDIKAKRMYVNVTLVPTKVVEQIHLKFFVY